jgi:hypothetical protein
MSKLVYVGMGYYYTEDRSVGVNEERLLQAYSRYMAEHEPARPGYDELLIFEEAAWQYVTESSHWKDGELQ